MPENHHMFLHAVLKKLQSHGLTLNKDKCLLYQTKLSFFGIVCSADGVSHDPQKVAVIKNAPPPRLVKDVHTFIGMVTYCSKCIQNVSDITQPLRDLTKEHTVDVDHRTQSHIYPNQRHVNQ